MSPPAPEVLYVLLDFPIRSERFIAREILALQQLGVTLRVVTLKARPAAEAAEPLEEIQPWRPPPWWSPRLWIGALGALLEQPRRSLRIVALGQRSEAVGDLRSRRRGVQLAVLALYFAHRLRHRPPGVVHAHFASMPTSLALLIAAWLERPFGFSVHASDLYAERLNLTFKMRRASHVLPCSEVAAEDLRRKLARGRPPIFTVHHGLNLDRWPAGPRSPGEPVILGVGRFEPKKGFSHLVEACAVLDAEGVRFRCEIVGAGPEEANLSRRIAEHGLGPRVRLVPWRSPAELRRTYARASVLAVPSIIAADGNRDNIPNVVLEALASGVPVVASALPALERILGPGEAARLIRPGDPRGLADALRQVTGEPEVARKLRGNGLRLVREHFDLKANVLKLRDILVRSSEGEVSTHRSTA